jgi:regulator of sigma E protease
VALNKTKIQTWNDYNVAMESMSQRLKGAPTDDSLAARHITVLVRRAVSQQVDTLSLMLSSDLRMGIMQSNPYSYYKPVTVNYTFIESFPAGIHHGWTVLKGYVDDLKYLFTKEGARSVGSFGAIGSMFPTSWNWQRFWELTAFISIMLAFMNILPIPALDGGHVFFLLCEMITRRKPSDKFMERAQVTGMVLLLLLMIYAVGNDIFRYLLHM